MKNIKFRVWDKYCEKMWYSNKKTGLVIGLDGRILSPVMDMKGITIGQFYDYKDDFILMQYTGLKDKKGKDIYEGDILKSITLDNKEHFQDIYFKDGAFRIRTGFDTTLGCHLYKKRIIAHEVVGNIYGNQELL